jgi:glycosyltransferase involved in cell wall biosynthesis
MRLLYVTEAFPYPLTSGVLRHYHLIRELAPRHRITLAALVSARWASEARDAMEDLTERIETFPAALGGSTPTKAFARLAGFLGGESGARALARRVDELHRREPFDVVLLSGKRTFPVLDTMRGVPIVADLCDATSVRVAGAVRHAPISRLPALLTEYLATRTVERRLARRSDHLVFVSERDRRLLMGLRQVDRESIVPNGVDTSFWRRTSPTLGRDEVVFTGAMDYPPNVDAALFLIREVMPIVRRRVPGARVSIVGRDPVAAIRREESPLVRVTGTVPDIRPYLESAAVFAAPLRFGVGMQNKIVEAMAMEVPVVTTPLVAEGIRSARGWPPISVARTREEAASCIAERLDAASNGATPDGPARIYVDDNFRWPVSAAKLESVLGAVVEGARARRSAATTRATVR